MAVPADPTLDDLVKEGMQRANLDSPTTAQITRAKDKWMEEIKTELWLHTTRHRLLETSSVAVTTRGLQRYSLPPDFEYDVGIHILDGNDQDRGTAQTGTASTITLAASDAGSVDMREGKEILLTGGTGSPQIRTITAYNASTKVATVDVNWATTPSSTTTYLVIQTYFRMKKTDRWLPEFSVPEQRTVLGSAITGSTAAAGAFIESIITGYYIIYDQELYIMPVPDKSTYGILVSYGANLTRLDLTSTLLTKLYREWRAIWVQGIKVKVFEAFDDERLAEQLLIYRTMLDSLSNKEQLISQVMYRDL